MGEEELADLVGAASANLADEAARTRAGFSGCPDPGSNKTGDNSKGLDRLKQRFEFLNEYSDAFITNTGVDVLIKAEAVARKLNDYDLSKKAEDRLYSNRESLAPVRVEAGEDNRLDCLHPARALPGATCSGAKLWLHARSVIGSKGHPPLSTYDMGCVGLGGSMSARGWVEIHSPASPNLSIKQFSMGSCSGKGKQDADLPELEDLSEFKSALHVLRGAMVFVHPWNRSIDALESFFVQSNFCSKDLAGTDKQARLLTQFTDYVLVENACRWRGMEPFLNTRDLRNTWEDFVGQKAALFKKKEGAGQRSYSPGTGAMAGKSPRFDAPSILFKDDICVVWNMGKCSKPPGVCRTRHGRQLRHVCNHRLDPSKPNLICEKNHMSSLFH